MRLRAPSAVAVQTVAAVAAGVALAAPLSTPARSQTAQNEVGVQRYDANDVEIRRFKAASSAATRAGGDKLAGLRLPVLAFSEVPQLVRNALGADAKLIKPRTVITDPALPVWYQIIDNYGDITITVDADLRINHINDSETQLRRKPLSLEGLKNGGKTKISIFDGAKEEGMEGIMVEYAIHKFPDIPYTVTIECRRAAKASCRDVATITRDQGLLQVIAIPR